MSDDRRPLWTWLVALLIGLPVVYVASFGPFCWNFVPASHPPFLDSIAPCYHPLNWLIVTGPKRISDVLFWYETVGMRKEMRNYLRRNLPLRRQIYRDYGKVT